MKLIGTHSGSFHADDALGVAMLLALFPAAAVVRSRDPEVWATCDALVDVGGEFSPALNRFDHHQKGFSERRENGIPYAGSGLVWHAYGERYVQHVCPWITAGMAQKVAQDVDARLIQHADAVDTGISVPGPSEFQLSGIINTLNATWQEDGLGDDMRFADAVAVAGTVLCNLVRAVDAEHAAAEIVRAAETRANGRILVLDVARLPFDPVVCGEMPDVLFVVYPESKGQQIQVRVVPKELGSFAARADLPEAWAGLRDDELALVTGVEDAVFCHNGRFICGARSTAGAIRMAELALDALK
ncbi:MYG1 family protein [Burkholderia ubonensis]|uniref:MYG1 family protein n=1 Tax=Burkholderia ubonensis TaxID=101571 RepID=UPI00075977E0|nr:MYG1 family protein [Burkholderia ubonensis]KVP17297.1 hypothetical protein WJ84_03445 [Burkholderia ubonensis]